jgi:hypothetical protein
MLRCVTHTHAHYRHSVSPGISISSTRNLIGDSTGHVTQLCRGRHLRANDPPATFCSPPVSLVRGETQGGGPTEGVRVGPIRSRSGRLIPGKSTSQVDWAPKSTQAVHSGTQTVGPMRPRPVVCRPGCDAHVPLRCVTRPCRPENFKLQPTVL